MDLKQLIVQKFQSSAKLLKINSDYCLNLMKSREKLEFISFS